jgi:SWI/SNF-related matrix-associated actin-dependent regulator 1 of chromatin subfamily A
MKIRIEKKRKYEHFVFSFPFSFEIVGSVKSIPGARYVPSRKEWTCPVTIASSLKTGKVIENHGFEVEDGVLDRVKDAQNHRQDGIDANKNKIIDDVEIPDFPVDLELYELQKVGAVYMYKTKRAINADDMGTGKTIQSIAACEIGNIYPLIVVCPAIAIRSWRKEFYKWAPRRSSCSFATQYYSGEDICVINFEMVSKNLDALKRIGAKGLIVDESHMVKNKSAGRTKVVRKLSSGIEYRFCLSGTILENKPLDIVSQLRIIGRMNDFGGYQNYVRTYCDSKNTPFGTDNSGSSNLKRLNKKLLSTCMIRRKKKEIDKELKGKSEPKVIYCDIDNGDSYEIAESDPVQWGVDERNRRRQVNGMLFDFAKEEKVSSEAIDLAMIQALKTEAMRGKKKFAGDWVDMFMKRNKGKKLVVFSARTEMQLYLKRRFGALSILAEDSPGQKFKKYEMFQDNEEYKLIVCSLKAANFNITLTKAHNSLFADLGWTSTIHDQAEDRLFRIGQKHFVNNYYILARNTIEEDIFELIQKKKNMVSQVMDGEDSPEENYSVFNELREKIKEKYNIKDA